MKNKRILIFSGGTIFPITGMHQVRTYNQIKRLAADHEVDCLFLFTKAQQKEATVRELSKYCQSVIPLQTISQSFGFRAAKKVVLNRLFDQLAIPLDYYTLSNRFSAKTIAHIVNKGSYDIVISHYWQASGFLKYLDKNITRCIDTHYLVEENMILHEEGQYDHLAKQNMGRLLARELKLQQQSFAQTDLLIVNSKPQEDILIKQGRSGVIYTPNGQDLTPFLSYSKALPSTNNKDILFYGALSNQFNQKALRRILNSIWPSIHAQYTNSKLIVMGSSPPSWLQERALNDHSIEVTGFVDDVRTVFNRSWLTLIPLESAAGFRGRTVELLASGVPIIGTSNALKSVNLQHGKNAIIADTDNAIIKYTLQLIENPELRHQIAEEGKLFAQHSYSLNATFGKLSQYFLNQ